MPSQTARRADIQGLRALAVAAVVLFHAGVPGLRGGFTGVDVFFVISGFLITGQLAREATGRGRIDFASFYARRVRRLLPAAVLVLLVTVAVSTAVLTPLRARGVDLDALTAGVYGLNYRLAWLGTDYLSADAAPSPLQHYWSLGVEEQFYLVWPLVLLAAYLLWRRGGRRGPGLALLALGAASLWLCVSLTSASQPEAFFWLPTRVWEFAAGGLVALASPVIRRLPSAPAAALSWAGLAGIIAAAVAIDSTAAYPGATALLPVLSTAAVIAGGTAAGSGRLGATRALRLRPLQALGEVSYATYLWHWPLLILAPSVLAHPLTRWQALALVALSVGLAAVTLVTVERPLRVAAWARSSRRSLGIAAGLTATACLVAAGLDASLPAVVGHGAPASAPVLAAAPGSGASPGYSPPASPAKAAAAARKSRPADPAAARLAALERTLDATIAQTLGENDVPSNVEPSLDDAAADKAAPFDDGCHLGYDGSANGTCAYADTTSSSRVFLVGDSHAVQWFPAMETIASQRHWRLESLTKSICPPLILPIWQPGDGRPYYECTDWRTNILARVKAERPALVVLGSARHSGPEYRFTVYSKAWDDGLAQMVHDIRADGVKVLVLVPAALPAQNAPECLAEHLSEATACGRFLSTAINAVGVAGEKAAVTAAGGTYGDVTTWMCAHGKCPVLVDNLLVYRDDNHLTTYWAKYVTPLLAAQLDLALERS